VQTNFSPEQLADPAMASSEGVIRKCVHCGFCTATCPTYALLGDELDSPRGRIYLMKDMLENERAPTPEVVKHIDRCLSCNSCMTTCPSGVHYAHLVDHARAYIHEHYRRPLHERLIRNVLAFVMPSTGRFRIALELGALARPLAPLFDKANWSRPLGAMLRLVPKRLAPKTSAQPQPVAGAKRGRVALLQGCVEPVLRPEIREATLRLLARANYDVVFARGETCCGSLKHHMGLEDDSKDSIRRNVDAWTREIESGGLDAIISTASGCGATIKDYGFILRDDPAYAEKARRVSALAKDITEFLAEAELPQVQPRALKVGYHAACSLQHGQKVTKAPVDLLKAAGFQVAIPAEAHLCCGSAGIYNIVQSEIADQLRDRKVQNLERLQPDVIAAGNIGCTVQIGSGAKTPVVHIVELLDWASGGPTPTALSDKFH
jgi:glycolate oxidase iron-sulfur subunit